MSVIPPFIASLCAEEAMSKLKAPNAAYAAAMAAAKTGAPTPGVTMMTMERDFQLSVIKWLQSRIEELYAKAGVPLNDAKFVPVPAIKIDTRANMARDHHEVMVTMTEGIRLRGGGVVTPMAPQTFATHIRIDQAMLEHSPGMLGPLARDAANQFVPKIIDRMAHYAASVATHKEPRP